MKTKVFAMYLPQYHAIPENSAFWGEGFTDWVSVKKATPLFEGHVQPKRPFGDVYYDLSEKKWIVWQAQLAKKHGLSGFGIYHYWFNDEQNLLTKPSQILLNSPEIDISYFFAWDNASWRRTWSKIQGNDWAPLQDSKSQTQRTESPFLVEYRLGDKTSWKKHFDYLLPFFRDPRYEKMNGRPVFVIYNYSPKVREMVNYWDELSKTNGFAGVHVIYRFEKKFHIPKGEKIYFYEPLYSGWSSFFAKVYNRLCRKLKKKSIRRYNYDQIWKGILANAKKTKSEAQICGAFVNYDDSPRRGPLGRCVIGSSPAKFESYFRKLFHLSCEMSKPYLFLTAWNEWGEGAYLEPDTVYGTGYLEALKRAIDSETDK